MHAPATSVFAGAEARAGRDEIIPPPPRNSVSRALLRTHDALTSAFAIASVVGVGVYRGIFSGPYQLCLRMPMQVGAAHAAGELRFRDLDLKPLPRRIGHALCCPMQPH